MGRRKWKPRPRLRRAMARLARRKRSARRSNRQRNFADQKKSRESSLNCELMERGGDRQDGAAAVSRAFPVLCARRRIKLPALPTQRRSFSRCAVQRRFVFAAHAYGGASRRSSPRRFRSHVRRSPSLSKPPRTSARTADSQLSIFAADETKSCYQKHPRFQIRRF